MFFLRALLFCLVLSLPQGASAQQREIFDLFGGMIRSGIAAATQADWERLPTSEVACLDGALRQHGSSINQIIRQGVSPSDPRMADMRGGCNQATVSGPSFDCRRARSADERAICGDPGLARLDRTIGEGYQDLRTRIGEGAAQSLAAPLLAVRRACGADIDCIRSAQLSTIREFQQHGAAIANTEPAAAQTPFAPASGSVSPYVVDGLQLGGHVTLGSAAYLAYSCNPSEQFTGLTWCQRNRQERAPRGPYRSTETILHSADGTALYINRFLEPAFFAGNEAMEDIRRLAAKHGEPHYVTAPAVPNAPRTLMVTWGEVVLQPLDRAHLAELAAGREVHAGILLDHIGNFQRSASMGLPVYRVTGGPGYVWAASWDQAGVGTLRFFTIDPSRLAVTPVPNAGQDVASKAPSNSPSVPPVSESLGAAPSTITSPPPHPAIKTPLTETSAPPVKSASLPPSGEQIRQPKRADDESFKAPSAPVAFAPKAVIAAVSPPTPDPTPAARTTDTTPSQSKVAPSTADQPAQPRVVGPPIAIQPVAKTGDTNVLQWAFIAAVVILLAGIGFLLFERRKSVGPLQDLVMASPPVLADDKVIQAVTIQPVDDQVVQMKEPEPDARTMKEPPPALSAAQLEAESASSAKSYSGEIETSAVAADGLQNHDIEPSSGITEHRHFGIGLLAALVTFFALMTPVIGLGGLIPLALAVYLLPSIIAFKVRHHYAWALAAINVVFGATGLAWLGIFVWALTGPRKSALDAMSQHSALGLAKAPATDPAVIMSDRNLRSGWKMPVIQAEIFSFGDGAPVESGDSIKVYFKNPVVGIWRSGASSSEVNSVRYNANAQIRCVAKIAAETKLRVGRTLGRSALTGIGAAILTGRQAAIGAAFLDYRFAGDEADEMIAALIVFSDFSSVVIQSESEEFEKFCALLPPHILSEEVQSQTAEGIDRIKRMAVDGPRVLDEMQAQIAVTKNEIAVFSEQAKAGNTFAERDEGRIELVRAESQLSDELAVLNAVDRLIRLAAGTAPGRRIA